MRIDWEYRFWLIYHPFRDFWFALDSFRQTAKAHGLLMSQSATATEYQRKYDRWKYWDYHMQGFFGRPRESAKEMEFAERKLQNSQ
jgi:hypothetical protein